MPEKTGLSCLWDILQAFVLVVRNLWWIFIPAVGELIIRLALEAYQDRQDARAGLPQIDEMTGERFEEWLAHFFRARGFSVRLTPRTGDYGVDLEMRKDGQATVVQAKRWKGSVGPKAIQEIYLRHNPTPCVR